MMGDYLEIDGSIGGGQILRSALSLSMVSGRPFRIRNIRSGRSRPGLLRQHLTAVLAAAEVCGAEVEGAQLGSQTLDFQPGEIQAGDYRFNIGSAGSTTLVLQTLFPALLHGPAASRVRIVGGTHNPAAPPADFIERSWLPLLRRMGAQVDFRLLRHGFAPAGGGEIECEVAPARLTPLHLEARGEVLEQRALALIGNLPGHIAERELQRVARRLRWPQEQLHQRAVASAGPGNILLLEIACTDVCELFSAIAQTGVRAERVADQAIDEARAWLLSEAAVGEHLADQLLLPLALAGGGSFTTHRSSAHLESNIQVIRQFLQTDIRVEPLSDARLRVTISSSA